MLLTIPDIRQTAGHDCGDAAVAAVCVFYGLAPPARLSNPVQGGSPDTVEALLRAAGLTVLSGTMTAADLLYFTRDGSPVLCPITDTDGSGHWVIVRGIERGCVYLHCPVVGVHRVKVAEWDARWRDHTRLGQAFDHWGIVARVA